MKTEEYKEFLQKQIKNQKMILDKDVYILPSNFMSAPWVLLHEHKRKWSAVLNIIYTENALENIDQIVFNITEFVGVYSAIDMIDDIKKSIDLLAYAPEMGAMGDIEGTREIYQEVIELFIAL